MEGKKMDQKEYLKRYLSSNKDEKKKKKKKKLNVGPKKVTIIDDDIDLKKLSTIDDEEISIFNATEDAPQIVGIIDERGPVDFHNKQRWKLIADDGTGDIAISKVEQPIKTVQNNQNNSDASKSKNLIVKEMEKVAKHKKKRKNYRSSSSDDESENGHEQKSKKKKRKKSSKKMKKSKKRESRSSDTSSDSNSDLDSSSPKSSVKKINKNSSNNLRHKSDSDLSPPRSRVNKSTENMSKHLRQNSDSDLSPPRSYARKISSKNKKQSDSDLSPPRSRAQKLTGNSSKNSKYNSDSDLSPPRSKKSTENSLKHKRQNNDSDLSPPRNHNGRRSNKNLLKNRQENSESDLSPPRVSKTTSEIKRKNTWDRRERSASPSKNRSRDRKASDSDLSPPRKNRKRLYSPHRSQKRSADSDLSPPRSRKDQYISESKKKYNRDSDLSPARLSKSDRDVRFDKYNDFDLDSKTSKYDSDFSQPRNGKHNKDIKRYHSRQSPQRDSHSRNDKYSYKNKTDNSPNRSRHKTSRWDDGKKSPSPEKNQETKKMKKTLDGTSAGLQNLKSLKEEEEAQKKKETEMMKKMSSELSGYGQTTVIRDRKTGRKRDLDKEAAEKWEKQKVQDEINAKYAQWGKGLKQLEDRDDKLKRDLHEMNKPLARYADDEDLDRELRAQEREDDPMLAYIREKEIKEGKRSAEKPKYQGTYMPNRFGIKPGYRWDGVDRSNGYEKKWFEAKNARKAVEDEAYKWSSADM